MCPYCKNEDANVRKKGFFQKHTTRAEKIQRYQCFDCGRSFSDQTGRLTYREKKPHENQRLYRLLNSGVSQSRCACILNISRITVARKIEKLARFARRDHRLWISSRPESSELIFDEMETFVHTKCKPLSISIGVTPRREVVAMHVATMPAKGHLAALSRKKYGPRPDLRKHSLRKLMEDARTAFENFSVVSSDEKRTYPRFVKAYFPSAVHKKFKGRRGCIVGQGELKSGGFDPLFKLNHTCAMVRDNLKTMSRRTWCTVKRIDRLQDLIDLYIHFHNRFIVEKNKSPSISGDPIM